MLGRHALAVLGDLDRHARRQLLAVPGGKGGSLVHVWQAGSAGEQLLAAHSVSTSCWRHVGEVTRLAAQHMFSELPGSKKESKIR